MTVEFDPTHAPLGLVAVPQSEENSNSCIGCACDTVTHQHLCDPDMCREASRPDGCDVIFKAKEDMEPEPKTAMTSAGLKFDLGKPRLELLDRFALEQTALVLNFGAEKYAAWNWAGGIQYSRLIGAALRHIEAYNDGEDLDPESGLPHIAHAMCCLMFLLGMSRRHPELDDRHKFKAPEVQS